MPTTSKPTCPTLEEANLPSLSCVLRDPDFRADTFYSTLSGTPIVKTPIVKMLEDVATVNVSLEELSEEQK